MSTTKRPRAEPCTGCGRPIVLITIASDGIGRGKYPRPPIEVAQHADKRGIGPDPIDDECPRSPLKQ